MEIQEIPLVKDALNKIAKEENIVDCQISISPGSQPGDNFGNDVYKVELKNNTRKLNLFMKLPREIDRGDCPSELSDYFEREKMLYTEILPKFLSFQNEKNITDKFNSVAKCYGGSSVEYSEHMILSDLSVDGFLMRDKFEPVDFNHTKLVIEALAKFHALSFALNDQCPNFLAKFKDKMFELNFKNPMCPNFESFLLPFVKYARDHLEIEEQFKKPWKHFTDNYVSHVQHYCDGELGEPYRVITHGDIWTNNTLYRYENGKPVETRLIDFELSRYSSPVMDVLHFIFTTTEKPLRDLHFQDLISIYYNTLETFTKELGSDLEKLFPYSAFESHLQKFSKFGLCIAVYGTQLELLREADGVTINENNKEKCIRRLSDVVNDLGRLGYL